MSDNTAGAIIVVAIVLGFFGWAIFVSNNETKIEVQKIQYKIDSLKAVGGKL